MSHLHYVVTKYDQQVYNYVTNASVNKCLDFLSQ